MAESLSVVSSAAYSFTCICPQKVLVLGDREEAQKKQVQSLQNLLKTSGFSGESVVLPGGCIIVQGGLPGQGDTEYAAAVVG